ncbi:MAG: HAD-IB family phosphatase [Spirochaetales bacterium]|nr:HAD-IB family phosphatase [Spirochaetales bacterium]
MDKDSIAENFHPPEGTVLAFFDLDETITSKDTDFLWALWRSFRSVLGLRDLLGMHRISRLYYSHSLTAEEYGAYHLRRASSMTPRRYRTMAASFARWVSKRHLYEEMKILLEENRKRGIRNVLITAQDEIIAGAFCTLLGIEDCLASSYIIEEGRFKGMVQPLCFREGKVYWADKFLKKRGLSWESCAFYSDSLNDLPLLEACSWPAAVHPGEELARIAEERSWPVLRPRKPGA